MKESGHNVKLVVVTLLASCMSMALANSATAQDFDRIWHVDVDAEQGGNGLNWPTAFDNLQTALEAAAESENESDLIKVAQGTYKPSVPHCPDCDPGDIIDRHKTFLLDFIQVTIEGGYAGIGAPDPDARDIEQYETILSGDLLGNDGPEPFQNSDENAYHVVKVQDVDASVRIDGVTITAGSAVLLPCPACEPSDDDKGGGILVLDASPIVDRCTIEANQASALGGGMAVFNGNPAVIRSIFSGNSVSGHGGGAIHIEGTAHPLIINCSMTANEGPFGGAMHIDLQPASATLVNCLLSGNSASGGGGGIDARSADPATLDLINCTVTGNSAPQGGGIWVAGTMDVTVTNSIFWDNVPDQIDGDATVTFSDVQGGWTGAGANNIDADPLFVDPANDNFRLKACSPAIEAGNPDKTVIPVDQFDVDGDGDDLEPTPDLDLNDRILPAPPEGIVDMGAYEHVPDPCPWDLNGDCCVDEDDLAILLLQVVQNPGGPPDFDCDGDVDRFDARELMLHFGPCQNTQLCTPPPPGCGLGTITALQGAMAQIGFVDEAAYAAWVPPASESEAFVCACVLHAVLEAQP